MTHIGEKITQQKWYPRLGRRGPNFRFMAEHLQAFMQDANNFGVPILVETGTAWDQDNFEGQGQSTLIWDWLIKELFVGHAISIDIRQEGIDTAKAQTEAVEYRCGDSIKVLNEITPEEASRIAVLYLDSFDHSPELNVQSAVHHLAELTSIWRLLPKGCLIVVDDRKGNGNGKHWLVESYLTCLGYTPVFKNCQIGWIK